jgi:Concanavalin A-like lectin/glucanases superfamily/FecR protein
VIDEPISRDDLFAELHGLITARMTEQISSAQLRRLEELVCQMPEARRLYVAYMEETVALHWWARDSRGDARPMDDKPRDLEALREAWLAERLRVEGARGISVHNPALCGPMPSVGTLGIEPGDDGAGGPLRRMVRRLRSPMAAAAVIGLLLLSALAVYLIRPDAIEPRRPVAVLDEAVGAAWKDASGRIIYLSAGVALPPQEMQLVQGLARLTFNNGAVVVLDARRSSTRFELKTGSKGYLHVGRLTARVEHKAKGFTVEAPGFQVVDLGTEFGVTVGGNGTAELHVFRGLVNFEVAKADGQGYEPITQRRVAEDHGLRLTLGRDRDGVRRVSGVQRVKADVSGFLRVPSGFTIEQGRTAQKADTPSAKATNPRADAGRSDTGSTAEPPPVETPQKPTPQPVAGATGASLHFVFDANDERAGTLSDHGPGGATGQIDGPAWTDGRLAGHRALLFTKASDRVRINVPGEFDSLTLAAWVRVDGLARGLNALMLPDGFDAGKMHWQLTPDGRTEFSIRHFGNGPDGQNQPGAKRDYLSPVVVPPTALGRWTQLVTVFDAAAKEVRFYRDGQLIDTQPAAAIVKLSIGPAQIGNTRTFQGAFGDFQIIRHALTDADVANLYQSGVTR